MIYIIQDKSEIEKLCDELKVEYKKAKLIYVFYHQDIANDINSEIRTIDNNNALIKTFMYNKKLFIL